MMVSTYPLLLLQMYAVLQALHILLPFSLMRQLRQHSAYMILAASFASIMPMLRIFPCISHICSDDLAVHGNIGASVMLFR